MKKRLFGLFAATAVLFACTSEMSIVVDRSNPDREFPPTPAAQEVQTLEKEDPIPSDAILVATLKLRDTGLTVRCGYDAVIDKAKAKARELGGNAIKVLKIYPPDIISSCYQMDVEVYALEAGKE